jgi:hypothetical protein
MAGKAFGRSLVWPIPKAVIMASTTHPPATAIVRPAKMRIRSSRPARII